MAKDHTEVVWVGETWPECDLCGDPAGYDVCIPGDGRWGNVCEAHFQSSGAKLGLGLGQRLLKE